jgi:hypothetical protein
LISSQRGAEEHNKLTPEEEETCCLANLFIAVWHFKPVYENGVIIGTCITYLQQFDAGGSVPTMVSNTQAPYQSRASVDNLLKFMREKKAEESVASLSEDEKQKLAADLKSRFSQR